jgi:hypothetical protein
MMKTISSDNILSGKMRNIPCVLHYLATADETDIDWFIDGWRGEDVVSVIKWTESERYEWALHVTLNTIGKPGEEAMLPFPWAEDHDPEALEAIYAWRLFANEKNK